MRKLCIVAAIAFGCGQAPQDQLTRDDLKFTQTPQITIESPAPGEFVPAGGVVTVKGHTRGKALTINDQAVTVSGDGSFSTTLKAAPGINVIHAKLNALWGGEAERAFLYGDFAAPGTLLSDAVMVRSNASAYDEYSAVARELLIAADVMKYVKQLPPFTYAFSGGSVDIAITDVQFAKDATQLALSPKACGGHVQGALSKLQITSQLTLHYGGDHTTTGVVAVDTVGFDGDIDAQYLAGQVVASMGLPDISLGHMTITTDLSFDGVDDFLTWLANELHDQIAAAVAEQIQESAANHFALVLNQLGLPPSFTLRGATLVADEAFDTNTSFDDAGNVMAAAVGLNAPVTPVSRGSLVVGSAPAQSFPDATLAVSTSFDSLNQGAFAMWAQGALTQVVYPAKDYKLFKLDAVVATPALPPVLTPQNGKVHVQLGDVVVTTMLHTWIFDGPVRATVSADADVTLDIDGDALRMTLSGKSSIQLDVNDLLGVIPDALLAPLSAALQALAPSVVEKMVKPIEQPLPVVQLSMLMPGAQGTLGLAAPVDVAVDGAAGRVVVSGDLSFH